MTGTVWIDSHCHVQEDDEPEPVLARAFTAGVTRVICVGTGADESRRAVELARATEGGGGDRPQVYATVGLHPHDAAAGTAGVRSVLEEVGESTIDGRKVVVAIGECGLDYHYDYSPRPAQRQAFAEQVVLAHGAGLPLVVHTREAWDDTFEILDDVGVPTRLVFHCFTGGPAEAARCLEIGGYLSFSGIVTFKSAAGVRGAVGICPPERILVETDSPLLAPVPHRGRANEPMYVPLVGAAVASARGDDPETIASITSDNAERVFGLAPDVGARGPS